MTYNCRECHGILDVQYNDAIKKEGKSLAKFSVGKDKGMGRFFVGCIKTILSRTIRLTVTHFSPALSRLSPRRSNTR